MMQDAFLTPIDLVKRYKGSITLRTLANWRCQGQGPVYTKIGGRVLYSLHELQAWEKSRSVARSIVTRVALGLGPLLELGDSAALIA